MSYAAFAWEDCTVDVHEVPVDGTFELELAVRNTGEMAGSEVVQLYLHDQYAQTTRPWARLVGYAKVSLDPGEAERIRFIVSAALAAFTGREGTRIVERGDIELWLATAHRRMPSATARLKFTGEIRELSHCDCDGDCDCDRGTTGSLAAQVQVIPAPLITR